MIGHDEFAVASSDDGEVESPFMDHERAVEKISYTSQQHYRVRRFCNSRICTLSTILTSLLLGFISGQFLRVEYSVDGYLRESSPHQIFHQS